MLNCTIIGTNWISHSLCDALRASNEMQLTAVYSRNLDTAKAFAQQYGELTLYTDLTELANDSSIDVVYIASPNSLHAEQAMLMMNHGKHVLVEKPAASNLQEVEAMIACSKANNVVLVEAMKSRYVPNLVKLKQAITQIGTVHRASLNFCQYSSRYDAFLQGKNPNTFNPALSNGSLMDIGVYPLSVAIELFGEPESITATGKLLHSGVDAHGTIVMHYPTMEVVISHSKVSNGALMSEVQGEKGTVLIESISRLKNITTVADGVEHKLVHHQHGNEMLYEVDALSALIKEGCVNHDGLEKMRVVSQWLTRAREQVGVRFPADG